LYNNLHKNSMLICCSSVFFLCFMSLWIYQMEIVCIYLLFVYLQLIYYFMKEKDINLIYFSFFLVYELLFLYILVHLAFKNKVYMYILFKASRVYSTLYFRFLLETPDARCLLSMSTICCPCAYHSQTESTAFSCHWIYIYWSRMMDGDGD